MVMEMVMVMVARDTSLNSIPSVIYFTTVFSDVQSSKRMEYPTSWPNFTPTSSATRDATDMAATRRGCAKHGDGDGGGDDGCGDVVMAMEMEMEIRRMVMVMVLTWVQPIIPRSEYPASCRY